MAGTISGWLKRLTRDDDQLEAEELSESVEATGATRVQFCTRGQRATLHGRLRYVDLHPTGERPVLVAELYDGSEAVQLIWLGRRTIAGIEPGRTLSVRGRVAVREGQKVIYNPEYDLLPASA